MKHARQHRLLDMPQGFSARAWQQHTVKALSNMELRWRSLSIMYCFVAS